MECLKGGGSLSVDLVLKKIQRVESENTEKVSVVFKGTNYVCDFQLKIDANSIDEVKDLFKDLKIDSLQIGTEIRIKFGRVAQVIEEALGADRDDA